MRRLSALGEFSQGPRVQSPRAAAPASHFVLTADSASDLPRWEANRRDCASSISQNLTARERLGAFVLDSRQEFELPRVLSALIR